MPKGPETSLRMPLGDWERLTASLPGLEIVDATGLLRALRMVKSPAEIEKLAHICAIGSAAFARIPDLAHVGQPLEEVFRSFGVKRSRSGPTMCRILAGLPIREAMKTLSLPLRGARSRRAMS